jgi:hypothetical protein
MPENTVYVGRPTKWGNPYSIGGELTEDAQRAVARYRAWIDSTNHLSTVDKTRIRAELCGKDLACWCPLDQPCHADVLLEIANQ